MAFNETGFREKVNKALTVVRKVLDTTRNPQYAADVSHRYDDKYGLAEFLTNTSLAALLNVLSNLGVGAKEFKTMKEWSRTRSVTLRFGGEERCKFLRKEKRRVESDTERVDELKIGGLKVASFSSKKVHKVKEYFWQFDCDYELSAYQGNRPSGDTLMSLVKRSGTDELMVTHKGNPHSDVSTIQSREVNITWLLQQVDDNMLLRFGVDRSRSSCATPRRNSDVRNALSFFASFASWADGVHTYFSSRLFQVPKHDIDLSAVAAKASSIFVPVAPLFEDAETRGTAESQAAAASSSSAAASSSSSSSPSTPLASLSEPIAVRTGGVEEEATPAVLTLRDINSFLAEQRRSIDEQFEALAKVFPGDDSLATVAEARIASLMLHSRSIERHYAESIGYIEAMLREQLIAAIGKVVTPVDFASYMRFHNRKLFRREYEPRPYSYAVRRPDHCPEGALSIESELGDGTAAQPILSSVSVAEPRRPMNFAIDAATRVEFYGQRYLHTYVMHSFSGAASAQQLKLVARARQFSGFVMLVGRIASSRVFEPQSAIIVQNKDDLSVPLMLETIPTPKEFADAIESMSPEQQAFAKAYRSMQLESTLFGVCIIQIKPQLERLLNLDDDSLTKEIRLTQELLELFIKYQIPSDLLSYDGAKNARSAVKIDVVKGYVANMLRVIDEKRQDELSSTGQEALFTAITEANCPVEVLLSDNIELKPKKRKMKQKEGKSKPMRRGGKGKSGRRVSNTSSPSSSSSSSSSSVRQTSTSKTADGAQVADSNDKAASSSSSGDYEDEEGEQVNDAIDYTKIPAELDAKFAQLDEDNALRPTIIHAGHVWTKRSHATLLSAAVTATLNVDQQKQERNRAFDLLDALSRSGVLPVLAAELHIVIAATHCFDQNLMDTVIQRNINPIEKVERSLLIMSSTIHERPPIELIKLDQLERVQLASPILFQDDDDDDDNDRED
jgi:hypothetical protein